MDTGSEAAASLPPPSWRIIPILALAGAVGLMASSIYIPSIPTIAGDLGAGIGAVQLTVTVFLVVFASGMLIHGPLSDRYGRKPVMIAGLAVGAAGSFGCALSPGVEWLLLFRIVQAAGIGTGMTVGRAVVRDIFSAEGAQRPMSALAVVSGLAPATAPSLGGAIEVALGWRWQFLLVAIVCVALCLVIAFGVAESNRAPLRDRSMFGGMFGSFRILLGSRTFLFYVGTVAFGSACYYVYVVGAPVVLAGKFQLRPDVIGIYAGFPPMGFMAVSVFMARFAHKLSIDSFVRIGGTGLGVAGLTLTLVSLSGVSDPLLLCLPAVLIGVFNAFTMPSAAAGCVSINPRIAGAASGLSGFLQMTAGAGATAVAATLPQDRLLPVMASVLVAGLAAAAIAWFLKPGQAA